MYEDLAQIVFLDHPAGIFFVGVVCKALEPADMIFVIIPAAIILLFDLAYKEVETALRETPIDDEQLRRQRNAVGKTWINKPFPDW